VHSPARGCGSTSPTWPGGRWTVTRSDDRGSFHDVAAALAREIAAAAIWSGDRCNWTGPAGAAHARAPGRRVQAALGPDLYGGSGGVALALAHVAASLDDAALRAAALGAIRHALRDAGRIAPAVRDGLYAGTIGVAYAAWRVARLLRVEEAHAGARELLVGWRRERVRATAWDLATGSAGAVAGLLALAEPVGDTWLVEEAAALGDELVAAARRGRGRAGWSWPTSGARGMHDLCGFAHGAAGIGHALLELHDATGELRFREAGEQAFCYERAWLRRAGAWPDLRDVARRAGRDAPVPASGSWCHGAPGIALSRLRAGRPADGAGAAALDRAAALAATRSTVRAALARPPQDFCLCHGAAGAADVLAHDARLAGDRAAEHADLAARIGVLGIERRAATGDSVLRGVDAPAPGLLAGLSGIALFYLRLRDPDVPTPLAIHRRSALDTHPGRS
jgi:lantibiotic modifying enzyme